MSPVKVDDWLILIFCGLPWWVRTIKGSKQTCWAPGVGKVGVLGLMVVLAALVPQQLWVAVTAEPGPAAWLTRLAPATWDTLPAKRLKLMVAGLPAAPIKMPPPLFPVIATLVSVALSPALPLLTQTPPPDVPAVLPLITLPSSILSAQLA